MSDTQSQHTPVMVGQTPVETWGAHRFEGRIAVVTGAARGIGGAVAERLIAEGATVCALDMRAELLDEVWSGVERAIQIPTDVGDSASVNAAFDRVRAEHGRLHVLVAAAGIADSPERVRNFPGNPDLSTIDDESWDLVIRVNLTGTFYCIRAAVPLIREVGPAGGAILTFSSVGALYPYPLAAAYPASKGGIIGLTRAVAALLAKDNIRVNAIAPAATESGMLPDDKVLLAELTSLQLFDKAVPASEMAANAVYLCSDEASFMTAQTISVNGGMVANGG